VVSAGRREAGKYTVRGHVRLEEPTPESKEIKMIVNARAGRRTLSSAPVDEEGKFTLTFEREGVPPSPLELVVGPAGPMGGLSRVKTKSIMVYPDQWKPRKSFFLDVDIIVEPPVWGCWKTRDIVVRGVVCKELPISGTTLTKCCPVPFAEVEVFDVDPLLYIAKAEAKAVSAVPLLKEKEYKLTTQTWPPVPPPPPELSMSYREPIRLKRRWLVRKTRAGLSSGNPGPAGAELAASVSSGLISTQVIGGFLPLCTTQSLGKTTTDKCGEFEITVKWPDCPWITDDESPDLIFKVTQTVGSPPSSVTTTLVSEGHHATRWDVPDYAYVELDAAPDVFVACNTDCAPFAERRVYFMGVGEQVIEQHIIQPGDSLGRPNGYVYNGDFKKSPFGEKIKVRAKFGTKIEEAGERYYRVLYAPVPASGGEPAAGDWKPITEVLTDTCFYSKIVPGVGLVIDYKEVALGPRSINGSPAEYYEIRDLQDKDGHDLGWIDENKIAIWDTTKVADGLYVLKLEVVMPDGKMDPVVHYGDDLGKKARMYVMVNNKKPVVEIKQVLNGGVQIDQECGSFIHAVGDVVQFRIDAYHEDDHLLYWTMRYQIGYGAAKGIIAGAIGKENMGYTIEDFHGKENELVDWTYFDKDFNWVPESDATPPPRTPPPPKPAHDCNTFGVSVELAAQSKTTDGEDFLGSAYGHYIAKFAGLAVSKYVAQGTPG